MLINVKMPTIIGILTFMSMINFVLSWVEHEKSSMTSGPALEILILIAYMYVLGNPLDLLVHDHLSS